MVGKKKLMTTRQLTGDMRYGSRIILTCPRVGHSCLKVTVCALIRRRIFQKRSSEHKPVVDGLFLRRGRFLITLWMDIGISSCGNQVNFHLDILMKAKFIKT